MKKMKNVLFAVVFITLLTGHIVNPAGDKDLPPAYGTKPIVIESGQNY
ncbi:hypothetical protein [Rossellomorea aquimaris]|uniref:Uncharacterized protein n=1 Tax=Rossellomorea aquimaris TaxID=189382 RepID=A0A366EJK6_9BACI|nr:hypothetical protein [Rossellomorea aquimaris]RBP02514.1 hypothetical protein DET59_11477 [Rossellomorea aquimaris]